MRCHFIPAYLLDRLISSEDQALAECGRRTAVIDRRIRTRQSATAPPSVSAAWAIHDAENGTRLPGRLVRTAGQGEVADGTVNEAATGIIESLALFADLGRSSFDDRGATVVTTVHYETDYANAFWDGSQLVFGDGDGTVFGRFTEPIDVLGHELSHAVTQYTADLVYRDQPGALNESMSDVFGSCIKQRHLGQDAASADWLVGEGIFLPGINGRALRSMTEPGTAYDDPAIGRDPQVGSMVDFVVTSDDNGGVHLNSGIPNRAFTIAARAIGGESWSGAGRIWYAALTSGLAADSDFATFAEATVAAAGDHAAAVRDAWEQVGVGVAGGGTSAGAQRGAQPGVQAGAQPGARSGAQSGAGALSGSAAGTADGAASAAGAPSSAAVVEVARSGGLAGMTKRGVIDLESDDPRVPEVRELVERIDFGALEDLDPRPDRFVYRFRYLTIEIQVHEPALTPDLLLLARLVLED